MVAESVKAAPTRSEFSEATSPDSQTMSVQGTIFLVGTYNDPTFQGILTFISIVDVGLFAYDIYAVLAESRPPSPYGVAELVVASPQAAILNFVATGRENEQIEIARRVISISVVTTFVWTHGLYTVAFRGVDSTPAFARSLGVGADKRPWPIPWDRQLSGLAIERIRHA